MSPRATEASLDTLTFLKITLSKVPAAEMEAIAAPLRAKGVDVIVSA